MPLITINPNGLKLVRNILCPLDRIDGFFARYGPEDLDVTLADNVLTIQGETCQEQPSGEQQANYHRVERRYGHFSRSISLPRQVNADQVRATLENGILHLEIPKAEEVKPRRIVIDTSRMLEGETGGGNTQGEQSQARGQ